MKYKYFTEDSLFFIFIDRVYNISFIIKRRFHRERARKHPVDLTFSFIKTILNCKYPHVKKNQTYFIKI